MRTISLFCLAASVLVSPGVSAQDSSGVRDTRGPRDSDIRRISRELFDEGVAARRLTIGATPALVVRQNPAPSPTPAKGAHAGRLGGLIGLGAGIAATGLYWAHSNCRYGSDAGSAMVVHCVAPGAAMIGGGWYAGRVIGRRIARNKP